VSCSFCKWRHYVRALVDSGRVDCWLGNWEDHARSRYGPLVDVVVGIVGAIVGGFIMRALDFSPAGGLIYTIGVAILGAVVLTALIRMLKQA
jgi:uncharacterized membrane protein YeaQ/YmgE (transglycosylase-associated protein family)